MRGRYKWSTMPEGLEACGHAVDVENVGSARRSDDSLGFLEECSIEKDKGACPTPGYLFTPLTVVVATAVGGPIAGFGLLALNRLRLEKQDLLKWQILAMGIAVDVAWGLAAFLFIVATFHEVPDVSWSPVDHLLFFLITNAVAAPFVAAILLLLQGNYFLCQPRDREPRVLKDSWRQALLIGAGYLAYKLVAAPLVISILYLSAYQGPADRGPIDAIVAPGVFSCLFLAVACVLFSSWHHTDTKPN
eukprot:jgi/Mesen1/6691/ME000343S05858